MPYFFRSLLTISLAFFALLLSSCLEGDEEYWLNADGSGRLHMEYRLPPLVLDKLGDFHALFAALHEIDAREDGLRINELDASREGGKIRFVLDAHFDDVRDLFDLPETHAAILKKHLGPDNSGLHAALGKFSLKREGLDLHLRRELEFGSLFPDIIRRNPAILGRATFNYTVHLPVPASESNAQETSADKHTLTWHAKLKEHSVKPIILDLRAPLPIPWKAILGLLFFLLFLGILLTLLYKKHKKKALARSAR